MKEKSRLFHKEGRREGVTGKGKTVIIELIKNTSKSHGGVCVFGEIGEHTGKRNHLA